jgi:hypothetical protein
MKEPVHFYEARMEDRTMCGIFIVGLEDAEYSANSGKVTCTKCLKNAGIKPPERIK